MNSFISSRSTYIMIHSESFQLLKVRHFHDPIVERSNFTGPSFTSNLNSSNALYDDTLLPPLPSLVKKIVDPADDTSNEWQKELYVMNPSGKSPTNIPSMSKDIHLNSKAMNNINHTHNDDKTNNELKMPYDEILRNHDSADEVGLDGEKCSTMISFSPQACMPSLNTQPHEEMSYYPLKMTVGNNQFSQMRNDVAVRFPVERTADGHYHSSNALSEMKEAQIEHLSRPSYAGERSLAYTPFDRSIGYKQPPTYDATTSFPAHPAAAAAAAMITMRTLPSYESSKMAQISDYQQNSMFAFNSVYSTTMPSLAMEYNQARSSFSQASVPPPITTAKERKSEHHRSDPWTEKFEQLKRYKDKHGNSDVPQKEPLGSWVNSKFIHYQNTLWIIACR
jgi:hypothetical protein